MNVTTLNNAIDVLRNDLGEGLVATDIWVKGTGQSIASYNPSPKATALFDQIIGNIQKALKVSDFGAMQDYMLLSLEGNFHNLIIFVDNLCWGIAVDGNKVPMGLLLNIAMPNAIEAINKKD